jgi:hypothetical protein
MTIDRRKYLGWQLGSIYLENKIFTINLVRHSLSASEMLDPASVRTQAKIIFVSSKRIVLSKAHTGGEVTDIRCSNDNEGNVFCEVKFSPDSSIVVTAAEIVDILF